MRIGFKATHAGLDTNEDALICGVSDSEHYLTFSRDAEDSEEDWGVHLEYDDQSSGDYNCVESCRLSRSELRVSLSRQLGRLAGIEGFDIVLGLDDPSYEMLRAGLGRVFRDIPEALELV